MSAYNCCCDKGQQTLLDIQGNQVGCITGYSTKQSIKILPLRGNSLPQRQQLANCPVHGTLMNENELRKRTKNMENEPKYSFKELITTWNNAVESAKSGRWEDAFNSFLPIQDYSAKMRFNLGQVAWVLEKPQVAEENFTAAVEKDPHMALAHFQLGMVYFHLHRYNESRNSYEKAKVCLRGNRFIDYRQLGFVHKLYECEVLYNLALTYATMMNNSEYALELLDEAKKVSVEARHGPLIEKAQKRLLTNQLYEPVVLPSNQLFRPPKSKVVGLKNVDYLGKPKVVSELPESSNNNNETNFQPSPNSFRPIYDDFSDDDDLSPTFNGGSSPTPSTVTKMTHKDTIATWYEGVLAFERGESSEALNQLNSIVDPSAKILYNIGILQKSLGQLEDANSILKEVVSRDPHLAIGHFQSGVVLGLLGRGDDAWHAFEKARETLRGKMINYKPLGLQYKLHKCEVLHNQAWAYNELDQRDWARNQLEEARECKADPRHDKIEDSYRAFTSGRSFKLYELPKPLLFKPPKSKIDNLDRKDYLGKAKIVAKLPTVRKRSSTPPPLKTSSSLGVPVLSPRSKTPTPSSAPSKALPVPKSQSLSSPGLPDRPVPSRQPRPSLPDTQAPWMMPVVTVESLQNSKPPSRPPPSQSGGFNFDKVLPEAPAPSREALSSPVPQRPLPVTPGRKMSSELAPSRPLPSPSRLSPVPNRPLPASPGKNNSSDLPPSRPLPSPTRLSPVPDRRGKKNSPELPPSRQLPSPSRSSPVPDRPLPQRPVPTKSSDAPLSRPLPSPKRSSPPPPDRPLPGPPRKSASPDLPQRPLILAPSDSDVPSRPLFLADRPVPARPGNASPELPSRPVPPPPGTDEPDLPSRPAPIASRISDLSSRTVPLSPNAGRKLPGIPVTKNPFFDMSNRQVPALPTEGPQDDLPSRPPPPKPTQSMPELPPRPVPSPPIKQLSLDSLSTRPVPPPPGSNTEPELPPRPKPSGGNLLQDRPIPPPPSSSHAINLLNPGRRSSSPGLPDLPPPPPPKKAPSPNPPRKNINNNHVASNGGKLAGNKAKLVKIVSDSPPVVRRAAAVTVTVQKEAKPTPVERSKPATADKPAAAGKQPPILAFKPELKQRVAKGGGPSKPGQRKTALVIASHENDVEGEVSVSEGDLITITGEVGDWLEVEVKGRKGRVPRSCVKDFSKPRV
ncbi:uncharacterized protein LOC576602 isoform X1 [Strongylocentrotus purpuratus]|uniref:SH3 domain-containing protein n=1 Tax=Strongylocentrotus purpuratus TaxID=7668 RepID=A0A7M7GG37_STRPU|nr:uncharacterized protein LOC576602 isoform X1 [Strongylocentrotus purpuratus]